MQEMLVSSARFRVSEKLSKIPKYYLFSSFEMTCTFCIFKIQLELPKVRYVAKSFHRIHGTKFADIYRINAIVTVFSIAVYK